MNELKDRFLSAREDIGLSQQEVADRLHISQTTIYKIEDGQIKNPRNIERYAQLYDRSKEWLLFGTEPVASGSGRLVGIEQSVEASAPKGVEEDSPIYPTLLKKTSPKVGQLINTLIRLDSNGLINDATADAITLLISNLEGQEQLNRSGAKLRRARQKK